MLSSSPRALLVQALAAAIALIGLIDAVISEAWDFAAVFALAFLFQTILLLRARTGRRILSIRPDLGAWLAAEAMATGQTPEEVADRCVAAARAGLVDQPVR